MTVRERIDAALHRDHRPTPLGAVGRGVLAGAAGTAAMTAAQTAYYRTTSSEASTVPAEVAKRIIRGGFKRTVDDQRTELLNNAMHWGYGSGWGVVYGLVQGTIRARAVPAGLAFGAVVWAASLVELPAMKLAPPVWEYEPLALASDAGFHLLYGAAAGAAYAGLSRMG